MSEKNRVDFIPPPQIEKEKAPINKPEETTSGREKINKEIQATEQLLDVIRKEKLLLMREAEALREREASLSAGEREKLEIFDKKISDISRDQRVQSGYLRDFEERLEFLDKVERLGKKEEKT